MDQLSSGDPALGFDLVAASIRADASDLRTFLDALAFKLELALPGMVAVKREGGLFKRERKVKAVRVQLDDRLYELGRGDLLLEAQISHQVRGITLKKEVLALEGWIGELSAHLARHAATSAEARAALERLVT
jgi:hypothetical protein